MTRTVVWDKTLDTVHLRTSDKDKNDLVKDPKTFQILCLFIPNPKGFCVTLEIYHRKTPRQLNRRFCTRYTKLKVTSLTNGCLVSSFLKYYSRLTSSEYIAIMYLVLTFKAESENNI